MPSARRPRPSLPCLAVVSAVLALAAPLPTQSLAEDRGGLDFERLAALRSVREVRISPDGSRVAYALSVPRRPGVDDDGPAWVELRVARADGSEERAYVHGEVSVSAIRFTADGGQITYLAKRDGDEKRALWAIPVGGGESYRLAGSEEEITSYAVSPDGRRIAFVAQEPASDQRKKAKKHGYKQEVFEEDWRPRRVWIVPFSAPGNAPIDPALERDGAADDDAEPRALDLDGSAFDVKWSPDGKRVAVTLAPTPLIDDRYMRRRIRIVDAETGELAGAIDNPGKLGAFELSPDGRRIAMITAADPNDPREGRLAVAPSTGGAPRDLMPTLEGHVSALAWQDDRTLMFLADVGAETLFGEVDVESGARKTHLRSDPAAGSPVLTGLSLSADGLRAALVGETPRHPREAYVMAHGENRAARLTDSNPWLASVALAPQQVVRWTARDGLELEGILIRPQDGGSPAPLLLMVHGGPEAHDRNGWVTGYSRPGQLAAGRGYAVLYPNYRGSTGRGVDFSKLGQSDAAGPEFDDLVDAVDHLVAAGVADRDRVGITGGSYGGYATAWCATRHTERFRAGVMFVGISNKISKGLTTEIPVEDKWVHTRFDPWTRWQFSLERSPVFHAERSRTALLIAGGTADTRVHPSQSLQLYRALKLIGETPVRYIRYPGEPHGNRKAAARDDYTRRLMRWMDHFVVDGSEELPPVELDLPLADDETEEDS